MDNACETMSKRIADMIGKHTRLANHPWQGEYAGKGFLRDFNVGRLTQFELVSLFEFCIRFDMVEMYSK